MMTTIILLFKLLVMVLGLIILPSYYFYARMRLFKLIMSPVFECQSTLEFFVSYYLYKILLILNIIFLLVFLSLVELLILVVLIQVGIVY